MINKLQNSFSMKDINKTVVYKTYCDVCGKHTGYTQLINEEVGNDIDCCSFKCIDKWRKNKNEIQKSVKRVE